MAVKQTAPDHRYQSYNKAAYMERLLQYMDDIDDLIGAIGLVSEQLRRIFITITTLVVFLVSIGSGIQLAAWHPSIALATCLLLFVTLLYRSVTAPTNKSLQSI